MTDFFFRLTPDWVLRAVEAGGFRPTGHCSPLVRLENRVYDVRLEDGTHVVAKFYRPGRWDRPAILDEHRFLADLREAEIPVCAPIPFADGDTLHEVEGIHYAVWRRTGGRAPDEFRDEEVAVLGRLLARIHNVGASAPAPHRPGPAPPAPRLRDRPARAAAPPRGARLPAARVRAPLPRGGAAGRGPLRRVERGRARAPHPRRLPRREPPPGERGLVLPRLRR